eukprot:scaffold4842_cov95-Skeletonema_marinoi.AAC.1
MSDQIVKSPPDLADSGPLGSCLDIRIVGFIFITHMAARRGAKGLLGRPVKFRSELWRARPSASKSHKRKHHQIYHVRPHRAPCSGRAHKPNYSSMDS